MKKHRNGIRTFQAILKTEGVCQKHARQINSNGKELGRAKGKMTPHHTLLQLKRGGKGGGKGVGGGGGGGSGLIFSVQVLFSLWFALNEAFIKHGNLFHCQLDIADTSKNILFFIVFNTNPHPHSLFVKVVSLSLIRQIN